MITDEDLLLYHYRELDAAERARIGAALGAAARTRAATADARGAARHGGGIFLKSRACAGHGALALGAGPRGDRKRA